MKLRGATWGVMLFILTVGLTFWGQKASVVSGREGLDTTIVEESLPTHFDWRAAGFDLPVFDQGDMPFNIPLIAANSVETSIWLSTGEFIDLSENNAKECYWREKVDYDRDNVAYERIIEEVINYFSINGLVSATCDPFIDAFESCNQDCRPLIFIDEWRKLFGKDILVNYDQEVLKKAIIDFGPVFTKIDSSIHGFDTYDGSYVLSGLADSTNQDLAVLLVGWDDAGGYWIAKNSYGIDWGDDGYFKIAYGAGGIGKEASFVKSWHNTRYHEQTFYIDETGMHMGYTIDPGSTRGSAMAAFTAQREEELSQVLFWTTDIASVDIAVYSSFESGRLSGLLYKKMDISVDGPGLHAWDINDALILLNQNDQIYVVTTIQNQSSVFPIVVSNIGEILPVTSYFSQDGVEWQDLALLETPYNATIGIRTTAPLPYKSYMPVIVR